jgi:hypothetical protein
MATLVDQDAAMRKERAQMVAAWRKRIGQLDEERAVINEQIAALQGAIVTAMRNEPQCASCGKHRFAGEMHLADEKDVAEWVDQNEGYAGPVVGEFYCGC